MEPTFVRAENAARLIQTLVPGVAVTTETVSNGAVITVTDTVSPDFIFEFTENVSDIRYTVALFSPHDVTLREPLSALADLNAYYNGQSA